MCAVLDPLLEHHRCMALAMNSGPLSQRMWVGAPRSWTIPSSTVTVSLAVRCRATVPARASRVNSSVTFRILILLPLVMSSNWKSIAHTWFGRCGATWPGARRPARRRRLRGLTCRPSWHQIRRSRLRLTTQPSPGEGSRAACGSRDACSSWRARAGGAGDAPRRGRACGGGAGWNGTDQGRHRPFSRRPRSAAGSGGRPAAGARGSPISPGHLLQHVDVESLVGNDLLEPLVLLLQGLQAGDLLGAHRLVLSLPPVVGLHGDLKGPADLLQLLAGGEQAFRLTQLADDLLGRVPGPLHGTHLLPFRASGVSHGMDRFQGSRSYAALIVASNPDAKPCGWMRRDVPKATHRSCS